MATQKKYHNLVLLDEASEASQLDIKKLLIFFLFLVGIVIGGVFISLLYEEPYRTAQVLPTTNSVSDIQPQEIAPVELQSITEMLPVSDKSSGCSIESLGRNTVDKSCSVDDYKEEPIDTALTDSSADVTGLDRLGKTLNKTDEAEVRGITNILDLK
jgi:hypothetical protein